MCALEIYVLNVGQGDTALLKTPQGNVVVIDAYRPAKVKDALDLIRPDGAISHLVVTHPHSDHYNAVSRLLAECTIGKVTLSPFWFYAGTPAYHTIINRVQSDHIPLHFLSGYERDYPDGGTFPDYPEQFYLELVGPPNYILEDLQGRNLLNPNHLSILARLSYGRFRMVFAADAQMENWAHYDREGLLEEPCHVLKAAHHGSKNGTQWERLDRLEPKLVIVSSDPAATHELPDLIGSATFLEYNGDEEHTVALTATTGTIKITVDAAGFYEVASFGEGPDDLLSGLLPGPLPQTDWASILGTRVP
jgi:competence protein ComEC